MAPISTNQFCSELKQLLNQERSFSASEFVDTHDEVAEQAFWERCVTKADDKLVDFIAVQLSSDVPSAMSFTSLRSTLQANSTQTLAYHRLRSRFISQLKSEEPSEQNAEQLRSMAEEMDHPLVMLDVLRLLGLREMKRECFESTESLYVQAAKIAGEHRDHAREDKLWLMIADTSLRSGRLSDARTAWTKAIQGHVDLHREEKRRFDSKFWIQAIEQRPSEEEWPEEVAVALVSFGQMTGCHLSWASRPELVLWCAIGSAQYERSEFQAALLHFKNAESFATGDDVMWLRILQSKCLASLGQNVAAAALLSGPVASENARVAIAATAAIGSAKLQSGAYRQGIQLLEKALNDPRDADWPNRSQAEADLALGLLILGDTDSGLESLHTVQATFEEQGERIALLQSLENELRLLDHEGRNEEADKVKLRIQLVERG
ncbi:hypothetical protein [Rhodopirellula bahusiensis]|uniref:hypothetical protein n=1 Tax=Rhodopirellula bahusiensis TaxID=2014065 RepID=UPI003263B701